MSGEIVFGIVIFLAQLGLGLAVYSLRSTIEVSILRALEKISDKFATKDELTKIEADLKEQIGLRSEIRSGFNRLEKIN